eukprot:scaffold2923_cov121-Cylindrotheca_fusiformis.AAC.18
MAEASNQQQSSNVVTNQKWILERRPRGIFHPNDDVKLVSEELDLSTICLDDDEVIVETEMLSVDAFLRTMMDENENAYHGSMKLGDTIPAIGYGTIIHVSSSSGSSNTKYKVGTSVQGLLGAQTYSKVKD